MGNYKIYNIIRFFIYVFEFCMLYSLEQIAGLNVAIFGIRPIVLVPVFVATVIFEKEYTALALGVICGLFTDISFGTKIGCYMMILGLLGYAIGVLARYFIKVNIFTFMILNLIVLSIVMFFKFYISYLSVGIPGSFYVWNHVYSHIIFYSMLLSPLIYLFNRYIFYKLNGNRRG